MTLYQEIENQIMIWGHDGTKTAGSLTRKIMRLIGKEKTKKTYIICSAVSYKGFVISGRRHGDAFQTLEKFLDPIEYKNIQKEDIVCGFVDNWGDFHTRAEAWVIADKADQILFGRGTQDPKETPILISEHLYLDKD